MYDSPMDWTRKELGDELDAHVKAGMLRGWEHTGGRYVIGFMGGLGEPDQVGTVVLTEPQTRSFLAGMDAALGWVGKVAEEVRSGSVDEAKVAVLSDHACV